MKKIFARLLLFCSFTCFSFFIHAQNVGINTLTPVGKLHIQGSDDVSQLIIDADTIQSDTNPLIKMRKSTGEDLLWIHSDDSTNVFMGMKAGKDNIIGPQGINNTFIGSRAGSSNTNGRDNTAIGTNTMLSNTTASENTAIGSKALFSQSFSNGDTAWVSGNVAVGYEALYANQPVDNLYDILGINNTAVGHSALRSNTTGRENTSIGFNALYSNIIGYRNTATGFKALYSNTSGINNTAYGYRALYSNINTSNNTATGYYALYANSTGEGNTAHGARALESNTTGYNNAANGALALQNNIDGYENTAIGVSSQYANTGGFKNTSSGYGTLNSNISGDENTAFGHKALYANTSSYNTAIGSRALNSNINGFSNTAIGETALLNNTAGAQNTAVGQDALNFLIGGNDNVAVGYGSGNAPGSPNVINTVSIGNSGILNGASNQAFIGNLSTAWIGGQTTWYTYTSDARVKNDVTEDVKGLEFIELLRPVTYHLDIRAMRVITGNKETEDYPGKYDVEKIKQSGFIAQEVEEAALTSGYSFSGVTIPRNDTELYTMSYAQFVVPLVKAVQEQQGIIETLQDQLIAMHAELADQTTILVNMENQQKKIDALLKRIEALEKSRK